MKTKSFVILILVIILVVGAIGGAFIGGQALGKSQSRTEANQALGSRFGQLPDGWQGTPPEDFTSPGGMGGTFTRGGTSGTVEEIEGNVLTLDALDGTKVRVVISDNTTIQKMAQGTTSDISAGSTITVTGQKNTDGSIQATSIFITPVPTTP